MTEGHVVGLWELSVRRLNSGMLDGKCAMMALKCIAALSANFPAIIDRWQELGPAFLVSYFFLLFEYEKDNEMHIQEPFCQKLKSMRAEQAAVLKGSEMTPDWLRLARFLIDDDFVILYEFADRCKLIPVNPALFAPFFDVFDTMAQMDVYTMESRDKDFMVHVMKILCAIAEQLLVSDDKDTAIPFAALIFGEIYDYSTELLLEPERLGFTEKALFLTISSLRVIADEPKELEDLVERLSVLAQYVWSHRQRELWKFVIKFIDVMINLIDSDVPTFATGAFAEAFRKACTPQDDPDSVPGRIVVYYRQKLATPTSGLIFAIASSSERLRAGFVHDVSALVLSTAGIPPPTILYFIENCCHHATTELPGLLRYLYVCMQNSWNGAVAESLLSVTQHFASLYIEQAGTLITPLVSLCAVVPPEGFAPLIQALVNIIEKADKAQATELAKVVNANTQRLIECLVRNDNMDGLFALLRGIFELGPLQKTSDLHITFYSELFVSVGRMIAPLWTIGSPIAMELMCEFIELSFNSGVIKDINHIVGWIAAALHAVPVPAHFALLTKICGSQDNHKLLEQHPQILTFMMHVHSLESNELIYRVVLFIALLAQKQWNPLFSVINPQFMLATLMCADSKIVEQGLAVMSSIILVPTMRGFVQPAVTTMIKGMLTCFQENCVMSAIDILISVVKNQICTSEQMVGLVLSDVSADNPAAQRFAQCFMSGSESMMLYVYAKRMINRHRR